MNQPQLSLTAPTDDVLFLQGLYWACVKGRLHGGYESRGAALVRLAKEQADDKPEKCDCIFWQIGGNCTVCGEPMSEKMRAFFQEMINADNPQES